MKRYVLSPDAEQDLAGIWDYIATDSIEAADRWTLKLFDSFESLAQHPNLGHKREDLTTHSVLFWPVGSYLVFTVSSPRRCKSLRLRRVHATYRHS